MKSTKQLSTVTEGQVHDSKLSTAGIVELLGAGAALAGPIVHSGYQPQLLVPQGYVAVPIPREEIAPIPDHIRGAVTLTDEQSFVDYVNLFKDPSTRIFATGNTSGGSFTAIFDYHRAGEPAATATPEERMDPAFNTGNTGIRGMPGRQAHTATYPCPASTAWQTWLAQNEKPMTQEKFVDFIDANARDVVKPASATLMELGQNFEMKADVQFQSDIRRSGAGGKVLKFTENIEAGRSGGGDIKVPDELEISIPVFEGGEPFTLSARMEWKAPGGKLTITYHLRRPQDAIQQALANLRDAVAQATGIKPLSGAVTSANK